MVVLELHVVAVELVEVVVVRQFAFVRRLQLRVRVVDGLRLAGGAQVQTVEIFLAARPVAPSQLRCSPSFTSCPATKVNFLLRVRQIPARAWKHIDVRLPARFRFVRR